MDLPGHIMDEIFARMNMDDLTMMTVAIPQYRGVLAQITKRRTVLEAQNAGVIRLLELMDVGENTDETLYRLDGHENEEEFGKLLAGLTLWLIDDLTVPSREIYHEVWDEKLIRKAIIPAITSLLAPRTLLAGIFFWKLFQEKTQGEILACNAIDSSKIQFAVK